MNLLEYIQCSLDDSKKALAIQLLNQPWNTDTRELRKHVPRALYARFAVLQKDVLARLDRLDGKPLPAVWVAVEAIAVGQRGTDGGNSVSCGNDRLWVDQVWAQVVEDLEKSDRASGCLEEADRAAFVLFYTIAHACLFVLAKVHVFVGGGQRGISIAFDPEASDAHRLYWFAHYMSIQSMFSDHLLIRNLLEECSKSIRPMHTFFHASSDRLKACCDYFADKVLSLHADYMHLMHKKDRVAISALSERLGLIVYIYLSSVQQQLDSGKLDGTTRFDRLLPFEVDIEELLQAGFSERAVCELIAECNRKPVGDRFLVALDGRRVQIGDLSLKYTLQTYCHASLTSMNFRGDWFEQDYIANYIRERVPSERYRVFPGIKDASEKYDADVIIEDVRSGALLFCQVKHRTTTLLAHLRDEVKEYMGNSQILHGLQQLKTLRSLIGSEGVLTRVRQRTGQRKLCSLDLIDRAGYLLIHNIENLDYCTSDGVAMYEWNTLRNLMRGTICTVTKNSATPASTAAIELNLNDPHQVMEALCSYIEGKLPSGHATSPSQQWKTLTSSQLVFFARRSLHLKHIGLLNWGTFGLNLPVT